MQRHTVAAIAYALFAVPALAGRATEALGVSGVKGGLVVHVGCGDGKMTAALHANDSYLVHGLDTDAATVDGARRTIKATGLYGKVSADTFDGRLLPYADGSVNLVVVEAGHRIAREEIMRVLAPAGVALVGGRKLTKPVPDDIDEWSHFLQGPENNPVAEDTVVGPPRHMQWAAGPRWLRSHEVPSGITSMVTAGGRLFYTFDKGPIGITDSRLPEKWVLIARDAFNGTLLWKIPVPSWGWQTWRSQLREQYKGLDWIKTGGLRGSYPGDYLYRMVADAERLYFTLGHGAPVTILDAATGRAIATCPGSDAPKKLLLSDGVLIVRTSGALLAFDSRTGNPLWQKEGPQSAAAHGARVVYRAKGSAARCLDLKSGDILWEKKLAVAGQLVISRGVVLSVAGSSMQALALEDGRTLWTSGTGGAGRKGRGAAVYVVDDTIWVSYKGQRVDLKTGKKLPSLGVKNLWSPQHHHRCYRNKATSRYIIGAMEGMEYLALKGDEHSRNNWVRGACKVGIMPANGMTYVPPDQCYCSAGVKILGFTALTGAKSFARVESPAKRLQRGPAYGKTRGNGAATESDWPAFRHDSLRSGAVPARVPSRIAPGWQVQLDRPLTQPVVVGDELYVASRDTHTLHALDANTGRTRWSFTAGGRIDSPPTVHEGGVLVGSADGHIYCLRRSDGELAWRFRAAPHRRLIHSFGQLESIWPVHGSVLVLGGVAYVSAGRSTYLDGGIYLYALDPGTGAVIHQHQELGPYEDHRRGYGHSYWSEGARNDVLVSDGEDIYIMQLRFDRQLRPKPAKPASLLGDRKMGRRVFSTGGFLDDEWYNRTFWMYSNIWPGFYLANQASKSGQLLVFDDTTTYAVKAFWTRNRHSPMFFPGTKGYLLFADDNDNEPILVGRDEAKAMTWLPEFNMHKGGKPKKNWGPSLSSAPRASDVNAYTYNKDKGVGFTRTRPPKWTSWTPIRVKAMVSTDDTLFVAGAPDVFDEKDDPLGALEGRKGGLLRAVSKTDGRTLSEYPLDAPPVLDGLIAARGRLFVATRDGKLTCWRGR